MNKIKISLIIIILLASFLRVYKLGDIPPSASWDEAAVGYNAYAIANWGKDEWGHSFPLMFKSFEDDKHPIHIYFTALAIKIVGLSDFGTRLAPAIFGVFNVLLLFLLSKKLFKSEILGLIAAIFLAISPYGIQFSRFNHEANFALFFFMLGLLSFYYGIEGKVRYFSLSAMSFSLSILSYHSALVFVPVITVILVLFYANQLWKARKSLVLPILIVLLFGLVILTHPALLGFARIKQNALPPETIKSTPIYKKTNNEFLSHLYLSSQYYFSHFSLLYLFVSGDPIPRHSTQVIGEFFWVDAFLLPLGVLFLLFKRSKEAFIILIWAFLGPVPSSATPGANGWGHAARALFTMGSWQLVSAFGLYQLLKIMKNPIFKTFCLITIIAIITYQLSNYLHYYYQKYNKDYAIEWQYGFKKIADFIKEHPDYHTIFVTDIRSQPYIFLLYYLKYPLPDYLESVVYNTSHQRPSNLVSRFGKYIFSDWDPIESQPFPDVLYVVGPSAYDGLRYRQQFQVKKLVKFPNGTDAFFIVSKN